MNIETAKFLASQHAEAKKFLKEIFQEPTTSWEKRVEAWNAWVELGGECSSSIPRYSILLKRTERMNLGRHQVVDQRLILDDTTEEEEELLLVAMMLEGYNSFTNDW